MRISHWSSDVCSSDLAIASPLEHCQAAARRLVSAPFIPRAFRVESRAFRSLGMADAGGIGADRLRSFVERIERLEEEKAALTADIREVYSEAKGDGFDTKVLRQVVRLRQMDSGDRQEQEAILDLYKPALGLVGRATDDHNRQDS